MKLILLATIAFGMEANLLLRKNIMKYVQHYIHICVISRNDLSYDCRNEIYMMCEREGANVVKR